MENFLDTVNRLQEVFSTVGNTQGMLALPQIVVLGSQSTGKSSVLESIVQKDFLPRGEGIVTRRPLVIQITQDVKITETWAEFKHAPGNIYKDFDEVRKEIIADTERECGTDKGIKSKPIILKITTPDLPSLTMVDLPGITKNPVGDQPDDIEAQILALLQEYIKNPNSIILAVSPGNNDIANSEALKLAREVDPEMKRTLAVITKVDLMEKTKENREVLEGKRIQVKLGIVGVINRSQAQLDEGLSIADSLDREDKYFRTNYHWMSSAMGTRFLTQRLCKILMEHVKDCLPDLMDRITEQKVKQQEILDELGPDVDDKVGTLLELLYQFASIFNDNIEGRKKIVLTGGKETSGGHHLRNVFNKAVFEELDKIKLPDTIEDEIRAEIQSSMGAKRALFTPNIVFDNMVKNQLRKFEIPVRNSIKKCAEVVTDITTSIGKQTFKRFPGLLRESHHVSLCLLLEKVKVVDSFIENYLKCEQTYINSNHRLFIASRPHIESIHSDEEVLEMEDMNIPKIKAFVEEYVNIIRRQLMDIVPKSVMCFLVLEFNENLHKAHMKSLLVGDKAETLMAEDPFHAERRKKVLEMVRALERAEEITSLIE